MFITGSCCGCSLKTGSKIIGIIGLMANVVVGVSKSVEMSQDTKGAESSTWLVVAGMLIIASYFLMAILSLMVVAAACSQQIAGYSKYLVPWLGASLLLTCTRDFYLMVHNFYVFSNPIMRVVKVVMVALEIVLGIFFWVVVFSFYHELRKKEKLNQLASSHLLMNPNRRSLSERATSVIV